MSAEFLRPHVFGACEHFRGEVEQALVLGRELLFGLHVASEAYAALVHDVLHDVAHAATVEQCHHRYDDYAHDAAADSDFATCAAAAAVAYVAAESSSV